MSLDRSAILAATPHFFVKGKPSQFEVPLEDLPREVRSAVGELLWSARNTNGLRVLAYAHYAGALNEHELTSRLIGSDEDLSSDVVDICSSAAPAISDAEIEAAIQSLFWDRADPWRPARNPAEGWAVTVLKLIDAARPSVLPLLLRGDVSRRVVLPWLLRKGSLSGQAQAFASVLMETPNQRVWEATAAFLTDAARDHVLQNEPPPSVPQSGSAEAQLIVSGLLLTEIFNFGRARRRPLDPEAANRWEHFVEMTRDAVVAATATVKDARKLLQSQDKDDTTLLALILGKAISATDRVLTKGSVAKLVEK